MKLSNNNKEYIDDRLPVNPLIQLSTGGSYISRLAINNPTAGSLHHVRAYIVVPFVYAYAVLTYAVDNSPLEMNSHACTFVNACTPLPLFWCTKFSGNC